MIPVLNWDLSITTYRTHQNTLHLLHLIEIKTRQHNRTQDTRAKRNATQRKSENTFPTLHSQCPLAQRGLARSLIGDEPPPDLPNTSTKFINSIINSIINSNRNSSTGDPPPASETFAPVRSTILRTILCTHTLANGPLHLTRPFAAEPSFPTFWIPRSARWI